MTQRVSLTIEQWMAMREGGAIAPPIWFTVVGGSMRPLIRVNRDKVMLVSVPPEEIRVGDIVLFPGRGILPAPGLEAGRRPGADLRRRQPKAGRLVPALAYTRQSEADQARKEDDRLRRPEGAKARRPLVRPVAFQAAFTAAPPGRGQNRKRMEENQGPSLNLRALICYG